MIGALLRTMRPHQWVKNLFVLAPAVFAHRLLDGTSTLPVLGAFAAFCAASSAVYLINDVADREVDRQHPLKRHRPVASGELAVTSAVTAAVLLGGAAVALGLPLGVRFLALLGAYLVLNLLYSRWLKHVVILDVMVLALGFVLRVEAGGAAVGVDVSSWLTLCTIFLALFLAFSKRRHELLLLADDAANQRQVLSHYSPLFLDQMINVVTASTVIAYSLYATDAEITAYHGRSMVATVPFVLYGIFRYLYLVYQRPSGHNPTEQLLRDRPFLINVAIWSAVIVLILYAP